MRDTICSIDTTVIKAQFHFLLDIRVLVASSDRVVLMDQNGTNFEVIAKDDMLDIYNFAYHETKNYIYWSSWCRNITRFVNKYSQKMQNAKIHYIFVYLRLVLLYGPTFIALLL